MERRLYLSKEKTDENDEQNDPRDESVDTQHTNMQTDENEEYLPFMDISNQNATPLPAFRTAFQRIAFSDFTQENLFHASNSVSSSDIQSRISDAHFDEAASVSPTSGIRQRTLDLESNDIASDSTNRNVPDFIESVWSSLHQKLNLEISASSSHEAEYQDSNPYILSNNEICLPQSFEDNILEPIFCHTDTNTETLEGNFACENSHNIDMLHELGTTVVDHIAYDERESYSDKAVKVSAAKDYDPQEGPSTMYTSSSPEKSDNLFPQKEFCESVSFDGGLNQHRLLSDDKFGDISRNVSGDADPNEDSSIMKKQAQLNEPLLIHTVEKSYACEVCGKRFTQKGNLNKHYLIHKGEKSYACEVCGKRFTQKGDLKRHNQIHKGEKPYFCEVCGKRFRRKWDLKRHQIHKNEKRYSCKVCGKRFTRKEQHKIHSHKHFSSKPYECETCGKRFATKSNLKQHIRTHSRDKH